MRLVRKLASLMTYWVERVKGPRTIEEVVVPRTRSEGLTGHSVSGYEINIHCQERRYKVRYKRWWMASDEFRLYHVFATYSNDCPDRLKEACKLETTMPVLLNSYAAAAKQKEAAINAYLDILIARLETGISFSA